VPSNLRSHRVSAENFAKAFALMAKNSPDHFADFMSENEDAVTADVFLQYVALGEVVYG
jgi:hypothetical protein